ncbi:MAG TPA: hypothetical protein VFZ25_00930, partial [Chloroflexota bacterium]|nr:hypothetical protein [Chloroflexota bacterium]
EPTSTVTSGVRVADPHGVTEVRVDRDRAEVQRGRFTVGLRHDSHGRLRRVEAPGLPTPLSYSWSADGSGTIGLDGDPDLLAVTTTKDSLRVDTELGGWEESSRLGRIALRAWSAAGDEEGVEIEHDLLGRIRARRWSDGTVESFARDDRGRLARWTRSGADPYEREYRYAGEHLAAEIRPEGSWLRELDGAGRVLSVTGPDGARVSYTYDARGQRATRQEGARSTRYTYDPLGQLVEIVDSSTGRTRQEFDGLGRRVARGDVREHRDASGRLWSVTDPAGNLRHLFIWLDDRLVARVDGPTPRLAELYASDPLGTPLIAVVRDGPPPSLGQSRIERLAAPPFGSGASAIRPSLYGHLGDPATGLIHFGAREYDPELGLFLTPDPWDGSLADPRRWAGIPEGWLKQVAELPRQGTHPYALCRFDPLGRVDRDGHMATMPSRAVSVLNTIFSLILVPTWAWPLTSISLFFFLPIDLLYGELIRGLFLLFGGDTRPMKPYTIANSIWATGSSRQGIAALGLNGILPSLATSGFDLHAERAVTIGNVIWVDRQELNRMARPSVLELTSLANWNVDPAKESAIHVVGNGKKGKRFHAAYWTRGYGNKVVATVPPPGSPAWPPDVLSFGDAPFDGAKTLAPVHLAKPFPLDFPLDNPGTLEAQEYLFDSSAVGAAVPKKGEVTLVDTAWFALQMDAKKGLKANDFVEINGKELEPIHRQVVTVIADPEYDIVIISADLPAPYKDKSLKVQRLIEDPAATDIPNWSQNGALTKLKATVTAPPDAFYKLATTKRVRVTDPAAVPPAPPPGAPAPAPSVTIYATVKQTTVTIKLSAPLTTAASAGATVLHAIESSDVGKANLPDPATPEKLKWKGSKGGIGKDDFVSITAGHDTTFARVKDSNDTDLTVELLAPKLPAAAAVDVELRALEDRTNDQEKATVVTGGVDNLEVKFTLTTHRPGNILHF